MTLTRERRGLDLAGLKLSGLKIEQTEPLVPAEPERQGARVIPLQNIEQIVLDGDQVTIKSDGSRLVRMTRKEFQELRGGLVGDLPIDRRVEIDFDQNGDRTITIEGNAPVTMTKYQYWQKAGQALVNFAEAGAATYLVRQIVPYGGTGFYDFATNALALNVMRECVSKEKPGKNHFTAAGNGSLFIGLMKLGSTNLMAYALVLALNSLSIEVDPQDNRIMQAVNTMMSNPAYQLPVLGAAGYLTNQFVRWTGRNAWEYCLPGYEEMVNVNPDLNLLQLLGQYGMRWLNDVALTEACLYYIAAFGSDALAANTRMQILLLLASDVALQLGEYFSYVPYPVKTLFGLQSSGESADIERGRAQQQEEQTSKSGKVCVVLGKKAAIITGICLGAYVINEITAAIMHQDDPVEGNTFQNRMVRFGAVLGIPLAVKCAAESVVPSVVKCCSALFHRKHDETRALLVEEPVRSYGANQSK